ncbi:MAG: DUF1847 domain-containing protein [Clostridiales Family XIII bacterium]|jgi:uncharacterized metal-binding protein|nr:DUF1847 domain-containing protein [Clostridiales Family XIII bacterium]
MAKVKKELFTCADCATQACRAKDEGHYPAFCLTAGLPQEKIDRVNRKITSSRKLRKIALASAEVEGTTYGKLCRVEETIAFFEKIGGKKIGIASCMGLISEARLFTDILDRKGIPYYTVCCKIGAVDKGEIGIPDEHKLNRGCGHESMCNPIMQAELLNEQGTDFNIIIGLCVGHDMLFTMHSKSPVTTLVVKDRVLAHNPVSALYTSKGIYSRFK